jgi:ABC-type polar amino acid transport system ATPase subunit
MLEAKNIYKLYSDKVILRNVSINVERNEIVLLIGPSGSGKTTLLKCLNNLIIPDKGEIKFNGVLIDDNNINKIREKVGMVFQNFNLFPHLTVYENMSLVPLKRKYLTTEEARKKAKKILSDFDLKDKLDVYPDSLSGGQKQRVAISRALMMDPEVLLFDEPTSALDPEMVGDFFEILKKLKNEGMTMVIVSHEMDFIKELDPKIIFLEDGRVKKIGSYEEIKNDKENKSLQLFLSKIE